MTTAEALRVQLDALRTDFHALQAENRRLKEDRPEQASALAVETELAEVQETNARLKRDHEQLRGLYEQLLRGTQEAQQEAMPLAGRCAALEEEVSELQSRLAKESGARAQQSELMNSLREQLEEEISRGQELDERCRRLESEGQERRRDAELEMYRAVAEEKRKWEAREARLVSRLEELEGEASWRREPWQTTGVGERAAVRRQTEAVPARSNATVNSSTGCDDEPQWSSPEVSMPSLLTPIDPRDQRMPSVHFQLEASQGESVAAESAGESQLDGRTPRAQGHPSSSPVPVQPQPQETGEVVNSLSMAMLAQQMPPLPKFTGDTQAGGEEERFDEWLERLELVGSVCGWNEQTKLVNLITRLRGSAFSFFRSCTPQQRASYQALTAALTKRFTPVYLKSVQSGRFHDRKQQETETVDNYAQELKRLFYRAYPSTQQGSPEAEAMGRTVLACQFVAGLRDAIKGKVAGMEGEFDQLVVKARFEEAKLRDLPTSSQPHTKRTHPPTTAGSTRGVNPKQQSEVRESYDARSSSRPSSATGRRCHNCGGLGHFARDCRVRARDPPEAKGKAQGRQSDKERVAAIKPTNKQGGAPPTQSRVQELRQQLKEAELEEALESVTASMNGITSCGGDGDTGLGPTVKAEVEFEGNPAVALVDTGSPVTIVSLDYALKSLAANRQPTQTPEEWKQSVKARMEPPTITLQNYGGGKINVVSQMRAQLSKGDRRAECIVQVQKGAPVDLLIGTDVQPKLGFLLLEVESEGRATDLLGGHEWSISEQVRPGETLPPRDGPKVGATPPTVRLIQATRLPGRHSRLVKAQVDGINGESFTLFESAKHALRQQGLWMDDGATEPGEDGLVTLAIHNRSMIPVCLEEGEVLGEMQEAEILDTCAFPQEAGVRAVHPQRTQDSVESLPESIEQSLESLPEAEASQLQELLAEFADLFVHEDEDLGRTDLVSHTIDTRDHSPIRQPPRRIPFALRRKVEEMVQKMLKQKVIQPSKSPWASPIVLVAKKNGDTRFCVDYRRLNSATKMDVFPLPRIDDSLDLLAKSKYFSTLDLASGYWQVAMGEESREKTAFVTHSGLYEFLVMPFGLCNAPATFQRLMETVLADLIREKCVAYLDDVLVMGETLEEHLQNLRKVLERLREAGLKLRPTKCHFLKRSVEYLGHIVSDGGVAPDPQKVEAVRNFPRPDNLKSLRSFLGLASYYRRFIQGFSALANPLFALTRKDVPFVWSHSCEEAFEMLKERMTRAPLLAFPDFSSEFLLETDASGEGLGAVLAQKAEDGSVHPIAYASRTLQPHERNYGVTELEALGVVWAVKHFRPYLYGHRCKVFTDHEALTSLLNTPHPSGKLARWGLVLQELDLEIHYRPGRKNANADSLSRSPVPESTVVANQLMAVMATAAPLADAKGGEVTLGEKQVSDPPLKTIMEYLTKGVLPESEKDARELVLSKSLYEVIDGVLYRVQPDKTLRIIPPTEDRKRLFEEAHAGAFGGHLREAKIHSELAKHYWWPGMRTDLIRWCRACLTCASRRVGRPEKPPLTPIPVAGPFDKVGVDVLQLPTSYDGHKYAVVFVDYLTKWPEVFPTKDQTALTIARLLVECVISRHGVPADLLSDRGASFLSELMHEVCSLMGIHKVNTTAYHPQTDGLVERFNRTLIDMLAKTVDRRGRDWDTQLPYVLFAYRASLQESTRESPFFLLYGRDPRLPTEPALSCPIRRTYLEIDDYKSELALGLTEAWKMARENVEKAQKHQKKFYDQRAREPTIRVGDRVFLFMPAATTGKTHKFARPFHGPYRVLEVTNSNAKIVRVDKTQSTPIFVSVSRLRHCPQEIPDGEVWPSAKKTPKASCTPLQKVQADDAPERDKDENVDPVPDPGTWTFRLRPRRARTPGT